MNKIPIIPKIWEMSANYIIISIVSYRLKEGANISVKFIDENDKIINITNLDLNGEDFKLWGYDDEFVTNWVCQKLNLQIDNNIDNIDNNNIIIENKVADY
jgi:hypothetical protein